jgi:serine/threonine protein kinase
LNKIYSILIEDTVENETTLLEKQVEKICSQQREQVLKIQSDLKKILFSPEVSDSVKKKILPANIACSSKDYLSAEQLLGAVAVQNVGELKNEINQIKNEGANLTWATGYLDGFIEEKKYSDAILETEKCIKKIGRLRQSFTQAKSLRTKIADPDLITVFDTGKYAEFIQRVQDHEKAADELESVRKAAQELFGKAEIIGNVPKPVRDLIHSQVVGDIKHATEELANFMKTANPRLTLSLNRNKMELHVWHRINISIENKGNAHALDVNFSFSPEFETRWIRPKSVNAGKTETFENIAIKPTIKGEVPLEISLTFHDARNIEYSEKEEFFIEVTESGTPHTPAYTPDVTPTKIPLKKQLPPELSHLYSDSQFIGRGGFARVFKATKRDGKNVAIKVPISIDPSTGRTFVAEIQNWTKMMHENIVKVYDYNIMPPYFEMELCDESLANLKKPVLNEKATWLVFSICEGLKYAHSQNIIHRDLKPQNILLRNGIPKISDWGLSRVMLSQSTTSASSSFTLNYAAPEQVNNRKQDARTDIWQLGVIFYELVTGNLPFKGDTVTDTIIAIATQNPVKPSVLNPDAEELDSIVMRCLEKDPAKRYPSVLELQKEIGTYLKMNYTNSLNESLLTKNYGHSTDYCADLLLVNMKLGSMVEAYKYASDLAQFVSGELKSNAEEFAEQLKIRLEMNLLTIPDELINNADILIHRIKLQRK